MSQKRTVWLVVLLCGVAVLALVFLEASGRSAAPPASPRASAPLQKNPAAPTQFLASIPDGSLPVEPTARPAPPAGTQASTQASPRSVSPETAPASPLPPSGDFDLVLTREQIESIVERRYGAFFQALPLPPERITRLRELLIERQEVTIDAANAALLFGLNPVRDLPAIQRAIGEFQTTLDSSVRNEFGESVFAAYRDFDDTRRERNTATDFAQRLAERESLSPEQEKEIIEILKKSPTENVPADLDHAIFAGVEDRAPITDNVITSAARILSPGQLEFFRELQNDQANTQREGHKKAADERPRL